MDNVEEAAALYVMLEEWDLFSYQVRHAVLIMLQRMSVPSTKERAVYLLDGVRLI